MQITVDHAPYFKLLSLAAVAMRRALGAADFTKRIEKLINGFQPADVSQDYLDALHTVTSDITGRFSRQVSVNNGKFWELSPEAERAVGLLNGAMEWLRQNAEPTPDPDAEV